jgi:antitoxin component YwqK of YwqJK toxin-antitoxin module
MLKLIFYSMTIQPMIHKFIRFVRMSSDKLLTRQYMCTDMMGRYGKAQESYKNGKLHGERQIYENEHLLERGFFQHGKLEGERKTWYRNGQLWEQEFYQNGELEGERKIWHRNGQLNVRQFHRAGRLEGEYKIWSETGQLLERESYHDGRPDGKCQSWYENGNPHERYFYESGKLKGEFKRLDVDGTIVKHRFYLRNGNVYNNWKRGYTRAFLNIRTRLYSRRSFPDFGIFIISDLRGTF